MIRCFEVGRLYRDRWNTFYIIGANDAGGYNFVVITGTSIGHRHNVSNAYINGDNDVVEMGKCDYETVKKLYL